MKLIAETSKVELMGVELLISTRGIGCAELQVNYIKLGPYLVYAYYTL